MKNRNDEENHLLSMASSEFEYDEETGQYYYRARMYSPKQSRFISNDPMGMVDGPNMYAYARDPSGCMSVPPNLINGGGGSGGGSNGGNGDDNGGTNGSNGDSDGGSGGGISIPGASPVCMNQAAYHASRVWPPKDHFDGDNADKKAHAYIGCKVGRNPLCFRSDVSSIAASKEFADWLMDILPKVEGTGWDWDDYHATMWGYDNRNRGGGWFGWGRDSCREIAEDVPYNSN